MRYREKLSIARSLKFNEVWIIRSIGRRSQFRVMLLTGLVPLIERLLLLKFGLNLFSTPGQPPETWLAAKSSQDGLKNMGDISTWHSQLLLDLLRSCQVVLDTGALDGQRSLHHEPRVPLPFGRVLIGVVSAPEVDDSHLKGQTNAFLCHQSINSY